MVGCPVGFGGGERGLVFMVGVGEEGGGEDGEEDGEVGEVHHGAFLDVEVGVWRVGGALVVIVRGL